MPKEDRFITFEMSEIYKSLKIRNRLLELEDIPAGEISNIDISDDQKEIHLKLEDEVSKEIKEVKYDLPYFVLALVFYCKMREIPVPKNGKKTMKVQGTTVIMRIELETLDIAKESNML